MKTLHTCTHINSAKESIPRSKLAVILVVVVDDVIVGFLVVVVVLAAPAVAAIFLTQVNLYRTEHYSTATK